MYRITQRFGGAETLEWETIEGRAGVGRLGSGGHGVPMTASERAQFLLMENGGTKRYVGISKVYEITH